MEKANPPLNRKLLRLRYLVGITLVSAVFSGAYAVLREFDYLFATSELDDAISTYKKEGLPWQSADLRLQFIPIDDNAAVGIRSALGLVPSAIYKEPTVRYDGTSKDSASRLTTKSALKQLRLHNAAFDHMIAASQKPKLDFNRDWSQGRQVDLSDLKQMRWFVTNLCLRFQLLTKLSRHDEAFENISAAWRLASLIRQEPSVASFEESKYWESIVLTNLGNQLADFAHSEVKLNRIKSILEARLKPNLVFAVHGYIFSEVANARRMDVRRLSYNLPESSKGAIASFTDRLFPNSLKKNAYYCRVLQAGTTMSRIIDQQGPTDAEKMASLERVRQDYRQKKGLSHEIIHPFPYIGSELLDLQVQAKQNCILAMIEALKIKLRTGKFPDRISDIPGYWPDPYKVSSLVCKVRQGQFTIYSIGRDLVDNGGKLDWTPQSQGFDVGVACPR